MHQARACALPFQKSRQAKKKKTAKRKTLSRRRKKHACALRFWPLEAADTQTARWVCGRRSCVRPPTKRLWAPSLWHGFGLFSSSSRGSPLACFVTF
ncbi:hypothetical protein pneo_cds_811 [Pandoravirus neocaledonia]|uniref:Uncharacterized protein n=1 Tax=Pandoravirus neocaledonia TaxID=2107708 RepID=A0A2U7UD70_9VIRU|nr:hypothetical protein pneo_cds_811 [Pandoravirus neocaledonia]AVK76418.1 hypothetical protein pneo_cds_811 [Pandoravirus neocaledonia]